MKHDGRTSNTTAHTASRATRNTVVAAILTDKHGSPCDTLYHVCLVLPLHEPTVVGDIDNKYEGEPGKHVDALFKKAEQNKPCVIFFDEADSLYCIAKVLILTAGVMMIVSTGQHTPSKMANC